MKKNYPITFLLILLACLTFTSCSIIKLPYTIVKGGVKTSIWVIKGTYELTAGTTKIAYKIGKFSFNVMRAPLDWPLINSDIETIDSMPVKEAIRLGRIKTSPYTVKGRKYYPMSVKEAQDYKEVGMASWYGNETLKQKGGFMTANGEAFNPKGLTAAHKYLPLPINVKVTNLENNRSIIVRVNDRGPFPSRNNPNSGRRIIDLSTGAAKRLGFYDKGTARVKVEVIRLKMG